MQASPINSNPSPTPKLPSTFWEKIKVNLGHAWKKFHQLPHKIYELIVTITKVVKKIFSSHESSNSQSRVYPYKLKNRKIKESKQAAKKDSTSFVTPRPASSIPTQQENPSPSDQQLTQELLSSAKIQQSLSKPKQQKFEKDSVEKMEVNASVQSLTEDKRLEQEKETEFVEIESSSPQDQDLMQGNLEKKENIMIQFAEELTQPSTDLLNELNRLSPTNIQDYLQFNARLAEKFDTLMPFSSFFEIDTPEAHEIVQKTRIALESKMNDLYKAMCVDIKRWYEPNDAILGDGNCLFWSINDLLPNKNGQEYYRKLTATYIREHPTEDFILGVEDVMNLPGEPQIKLQKYAKLQGGWNAWKKKLEKTLKRTPNSIDLYTDCMANSKLWGGHNEIMALSEVLKVPILVFTRKDSVSWRFDLIAGQKFSDQPPLLLYNNGSSHYQSLIAKSDTEVTIKNSVQND